MILDSLIQVLENLSLTVSAEEVADLVWLLIHWETSQSGNQELQSLPPPTQTAAQTTLPLQRPMPDPQQRPEISTSTTPIAPVHARSPTRYQQTPLTEDVPIRVASARALPEPLMLARALRPLMRRVFSRTDSTIDLDATVRQIADNELIQLDHKPSLWYPILRPKLEDWLELALVIDSTPSMHIWQQTLRELQDLLQSQGAFRKISFWTIGTDEKTISLYAGVQPQSAPSTKHRFEELIDPSRRRLILIVSDCVSLAWQNGAVSNLLYTWSRDNLVSIVQVLPPRLWSRTALGNHEFVTLSAAQTEISNKQLTIKNTSFGLHEVSSKSIAIPILMLEPSSLSDWAHLVVGNSKVQMPGVVLLNGFTDSDDLDILLDIPKTPQERVDNFRLSAMPYAWLLTTRLASVPLTLSVIHLIHELTEPIPRLSTLAEVMLGGLLKRITPNSGKASPDSVQYEFLPGVMDILLPYCTPSERTALLSHTSAWIAARHGQIHDFGALLRNPTVSNYNKFQAEQPAFAELSLSLLYSLGGKYADLARKIEASPKGSSSAAPTPSSKLPATQPTHKPQISSRVRTQSSSSSKLPATQPTHASLASSHDRTQLVSSNEIYVTVFNDPLNHQGRVKFRTQLIGGKEYVHAFAPPFDLQSLPQHYMQLDEWITAAGNQLMQEGKLDSNATPHERVLRVGAALFDALFPKGSEGRGLFQTKAEIAERSKRPLRIRLEVDQALGGVPWNILWDTVYQRWLAQDHSRTLIQIPAGSTPAKPKRSRQPERLHVVLVTASAAHPSSLEADQRYSKRLQECFEASQHQHSIDFKEITGLNTYGQLEQCIQQDTPLHILDIFAHGRIDGDENILTLTDEAGEIISLPITWLNSVLRQRRKVFPQHHIFLTLLNNCDSARSIPHSLLAGLAQGLVNDGMPMVLGMQSQVLVETVHTFMPLFYRAILSGQTIDEALNSARRAIYNNYYSDVDWAVPVLYVSPDVQDLLLFKPRLKKQSASITQSRQLVQISRHEFLDAHALREGDSRSQLFAKRSEDFQEGTELDAIFVEGSLKRLSNHDPNVSIAITPGLGPRHLRAPQSLFVLAPPGYGKTAYRLVTERAIKSSDLILSIDLGIAVEEANMVSLVSYQALIRRKIVETLQQQLPPEKAAEIQRWPESEVGAAPSSFSNWIVRAVHLVRSSGFQHAHVIFDGLNNLEQNIAKATGFLTHLIGNPALLRIPGFAFKFFLPDDDAQTMQNFVIAQLGPQRADFPIYRLVRWEKPQLMRFLNRRLDHFTIKERGSSQPPVRLQDLFDTKLTPTIEARLCTAAQGSPRRLIELLECMVDQHCATCQDPSDHIPQAVVDACLRS